MCAKRVSERLARRRLPVLVPSRSGASRASTYGVAAAFQPSHEFGRVLAAYGGVFIVGSLLWGVIFDGFHPDRSDLAGALICLAGVTVIMYGR